MGFKMRNLERKGIIALLTSNSEPCAIFRLLSLNSMLALQVCVCKQQTKIGVHSKY